MRPIHLALLSLCLVAGCASTPLGQCQAPYRAELRIVEKDLKDTADALRQGYRLVPTGFNYGVHYCITPSGRARLCRAKDGEPMYDKRRINRAAETAKLAALQAEQTRLEAAIATCRAKYPQ